MNRILKSCFLLLFVAIFIFISVNVYAKEEITLVVNGNLVETKDKPIIRSGRTLVPVRVISENLGYKVKWNAKSREVRVSKDNESILLKVGDKNAEVRQGNIVSDAYIDVSPKIVNNRVYVPVRFIAENYGEKVFWDETNRMVIIGDYEFDFKGDINLKSRERREYPELDLIMYLPKDFDDKILTRYNIENNSYDFYTKNRREYLASLSKAYKRSNINVLPTVILKYEDGFFTEINYASDVQYSYKTKSDYLKKLNYLKESFSTIEF